MNKKTFIAFLVVAVSVLTLFCGCNKKTDDTTILNTEDTTIVNTEIASAEANTDPSAPDSTTANQDVPATAYKDANELEIMTVPNPDSQESDNSQQSTNPQKEPELDDYIQSESEIELPFIAIE